MHLPKQMLHVCKLCRIRAAQSVGFTRMHHIVRSRGGSGACEGMSPVQGNLFVVSRLGQVRNAQTLIRQEGARDNHLAVLQTAANPLLTATISAHIDATVFDEIVHITQPHQPLKQGRHKNRVIYEQFEELLVRMADKGVRNLFLCNVDAYYSLFERVIERRELPLTLNLLEEGLGTYANLGERVYTKDMSVHREDVVLRARNAGRAWSQAIRASLILVATALSWVFRVDLFRVRRELLAALLVRPLHRYGTITHFDRAFVCFPEKVHDTNIKIDFVARLMFEIAEETDAKAVRALPEGATLFVSQKYLGASEYVPIIMQMFDELRLERVFFKFHPREDRFALERLIEEERSRHPRLEVTVPRAIQRVPVENLIASGRVAKVVGLTSTSLMYAQAFFDGVEVVSVAQRFKQLALAQPDGIARRALAEFDRDLDVFEDVSGVTQHRVT